MSVGQLLSLPSAATGLAPVSSATAWAFGTPVAVGTLATDIEVIFFNFQNTDIPVVDTLQEILFEITVGGTTVLQIPFSMKADSLVGWEKSPSTSSSNNFYLTEPFFIPKDSVVAIKVCDSIAAALTYNGVKILYRELAHPTTALNTPGDASSDADTTPTLNFTGTDSETDVGLEYQVQVDTVNSFDSNSTPVLIMGLPAINRAAGIGSCTLLAKDGVATAGTLDTVELWFVGDVTGVKVGTFYGSGTSWTIRDYATIGNVTGGSKQTFSGLGITAEAGDIIGVYFTGNSIEVDVSGFNGLLDVVGDKFSAGATTYSNDAGWGASIAGYFITATPLINAVSATDAGFTSGHPFDSATAKEYTPAALTAPDTYYWRVRAARAGSIDYGDWSSIRSFDVTTGGAVANTGFFGFM